jgi:tetratricopeptide (TPR) repeat protein
MANSNEQILNEIFAELPQPLTVEIVLRRIQLCHKALEILPESQNVQKPRIHLILGDLFVIAPPRKGENNLALAVKNYIQALEGFSRSEFPQEWALVQHKLGYLYYWCNQGNRADNIDKAIDHFNKALDVGTHDKFPALWAATHKGLEEAYIHRINGDRARNVEKAIEHCNLALDVYTREAFPALWAALQNDLGFAIWNRIQNDREEDIESAIAYYNRALEVWTKDDFPVEWALTNSNLANAYRHRIRDARAENIDKAIEYYNHALEMYTREIFPREWVVIHKTLADLFWDRNWGDRADNIEKAIEHRSHLLEVWTKDTFPKEWAETQNRLGVAFSHRIQSNRAENFEKAIECYNHALEVWSKSSDPENWGNIQNNLGYAYWNRIKGDLAENIETAIECYNRALEIKTKENSPNDWAMTQNNLGNAFWNRVRENRAENIEKAIEYYNSALEIYTRKLFPLKWAMVQNNLGNAYLNRIREDCAENLEKALEYYNFAIEIRTKENYPFDWAITQNNLANAWGKRIQGDPEDNIEKAIEHYNLALEIHTREKFPLEWARLQYNLGNQYGMRRKGDPKENLKKGIGCVEEALKIKGPDTYPQDCRSIANLLGILYSKLNDNLKSNKDHQTKMETIGEIVGNSLQMKTAYQTAIEATENLYHASLFSESLEAELAESGDLYRRAAYAIGTLGDVYSIREAIVILEHGRARTLGESLAQDRVDLELVKEKDPDAHNLFYQAIENLRHIERQRHSSEEPGNESEQEFSMESLRTQSQQAHEQMETALNRIRLIPGLQRFLMNPDWDEIAAVAKSDTALVFIDCSVQGGVAFLLEGHGKQGEKEGIVVYEIKFPAFREKFLNNLINKWEKGPIFCDPSVLETIGENMMKPIVLALNTRGYTQACLIPAGNLGIFPLHAASWTEDGKKVIADDRLAFSYAPSARALIYARKIADRTPASNLLAIDQPKCNNVPKLPHSRQEVTYVASFFSTKTKLTSNKAKKDEVLKVLPDADVVHFSCHGKADVENPLRSYLLMTGNEKLTMADLYELHHKGARMATLSACETAKIGTKLPDEVLSLSTSFLRAGFAGVIASLWQVTEESTSILLEKFYEGWMKDGLTPVQALQRAQQYVRGIEEFEHPFFWAAFSLTGT